MKKLQCAEARQIDLVDYLASLGYEPNRTKSNDYWYCSPLRKENTPSFKVNRQLNVWYDHGIGKGGDLIDFGTAYFQCNVSDLLDRLSQQPPLSFSFQPQNTESFAGERKDSVGKIVIVESRSLQERSLLNYLNKRGIPRALAFQNCREVDFRLYGKIHMAIGFQNNAGGYELRSESFKGSSAPKAVTLIDNGQPQLSVFEGFFNYLSFLTMNLDRPGTNFLILNSLSFFERSRQTMEEHERVNLYLDRDPSGSICTQKALQWNGGMYVDRSQLYMNHKDLNDFLIQHQAPKKSQRLGHGL